MSFSLKFCQLWYTLRGIYSLIIQLVKKIWIYSSPAKSSVMECSLKGLEEDVWTYHMRCCCGNTAFSGLCGDLEWSQGSLTAHLIGYSALWEKQPEGLVRFLYMILKYSKMSPPRLSAKCEARSHCSEQSLLKVNVEFEIMTCFYQMEKRGGGSNTSSIVLCIAI